MAEIKIAGIMRAGVYSPNHVGNDAAILNLVAEQLRKRGYEVRIYSEEQLKAGKVTESIVLNMCRERESIEILQAMEDNGALVINSGYGIENCIRERMTRILIGSNIPYPESLIVNTNEVVRNALVQKHFDRCWIKRGDTHPLHQEDVSYCRNPQETQEVLQEYFLRGIKRAVICRHLPGDLIKFYGVTGTDFFYWFYPFETHSSKDGDTTTRPDLDETHLKKICQGAADTLDVRVYGGECIVSPDNTINIIDFNDWPSFAPCRNEAAPHIARAVMGEIKKFNSTKLR